MHLENAVKLEEQGQIAAVQRLSVAAVFERTKVARERAERELIKQALRKCGGTKNRAAELLGISRFALQRKLEKMVLKMLDE